MPGSNLASETSLTQLREQRKTLCREIGQRKARGEPVGDLIERSRALSAEIARLSGDRQVAGKTETPTGAKPWTTEVLTSSAQIGALRKEWRDLLARSQDDSPFLTWEWMVSWYETYEDEGAVRCLTVRDSEGRWIGLAPLFLSHRRDAKLSRRQIGFASTYGHSWGSYLELVSTPEAQETVAGATAEYLRTTRDQWDCTKFLRVPAEGDSVWPLIRAMASLGLQTAVRPGLRCAVLPLPGETRDVAAILASAKLRRNCRAALRRLQKDHPHHAFRISADRETLAEILEKHITLNIRGCSQRKRATNFAHPQYRLCFRRAAQRFAEADQLRVVLLEIDGEVVATLVCVLYAQTLYLWSSAWAPERTHYEVSHLIFLEALKAGIQEGAWQADFLPGDQAYKFQYTQECRQLLDIAAWPNRLQMARTTCGELWERALDRVTRLIRRTE